MGTASSTDSSPPETASPAPAPSEPSSPVVVRKSFWAKPKEYFTKYAFWLGVFAAVYFWVTVAYDGHINSSWWSIWTSSFSALGDPGANSTGAAASLYWFYNDVVIFPTGGMLIIFAASLVMISRNWLQSVGSGFLMVAGIFLVMVGIFHGGNPTPAGYHDFVSNWFFVQALLAVWVWTFGLLLERRWVLGMEMFAIAILAPVIAASIKWPSVATTEAFGIAAIDLWLVLLYFARKPKVRVSNGTGK